VNKFKEKRRKIVTTSSRKTRIIAVANEKGGVGKTVTVINLGAALTLEEKKVLVVDMDPQANATRGLGVHPPEDAVTVYDLISGNGPGFGKAIVPTAWEDLDLICSTVDLAGAEVELVDAEGRENRLSDALSPVIGDYDFVLVDTPPSLSLLTVNVFCFAREVLVPCQTQPYSLKALDELFDTIDAVKEALNPDLGVTGIVPTFFDRRTRVSSKVLSRLKSDERYRDFVYKTVIRINTTIAESAEVEKPVVFFRPSSFGAIDYRDLAEELLK
jgi:chromosome partitioning protein